MHLKIAPIVTQEDVHIFKTVIVHENLVETPFTYNFFENPKDCQMTDNATELAVQEGFLEPAFLFKLI